MPTVAQLAAMVSVGGVSKAKSELAAFEKGLKGSASSINALGAVGHVALAGLAVGAATAAAGMGVSANAAISFEKQMSSVKAVSNASAAEMAQLSDLALKLGKDTAFTASEAGAGIEELVKAGVSVADVMGGAATASLNLAAAGGTSIAEAAEIAANALNMFNLKGGDMAHVADQIAGAANASSLNVSDFRLSLQQVGAVANMTGQSFDSTATSIALMGAAGIKGSDAGTSLKTMLMNLQPATANARAMFDQLGITVNGANNKLIDANGKFKSMREISEILRQSLEGLTDADKQMALEVMFGSDAIRAAAIMAEGGSAAYDQMADSMSKVTAEAVGNERLNNLAGDLEQLQGSAETLAISFGRELTPELRTLTQGATKLLNEAIEYMPAAISLAREEFSKLKDGITPLADQAIPTLNTAAKVSELVFADVKTTADQVGTAINAVSTIVGAALAPFNSLTEGADRLRIALYAIPGVGPALGGTYDYLGEKWKEAEEQQAAMARAAVLSNAAVASGSASASVYAAATAKGTNALQDRKNMLDSLKGIEESSIDAQENLLRAERNADAQRRAEAEYREQEERKRQNRGPLTPPGSGSSGRSEAQRAAEDAIRLMRDMDRVAADSMAKIEQIGVKTGRAINEATADAARGIREAHAEAERALRDLEQQELINASTAARRDALEARLSGEDLVRSRQRADEDSLWQYGRDLAKAKTAQERADLLARRTDELEVLAYRRQREDEDTAWRKAQERARVELESQLHQEELDRQRARIIEERDAKIRALNEQLAERIRTLKEEAAEAIVQERNAAIGKLQEMKENFWDKVAEAARPGLLALAAEIDEIIGSRMKMLEGLSGLVSTSAGLPKTWSSEKDKPSGVPGMTVGELFRANFGNNAQAQWEMEDAASHDYPGPAYAGETYKIGTAEYFRPAVDGYIAPIGGASVGGLDLRELARIIQSQPVVLMLDGRVIAESTRAEILRYQQRNGNTGFR
jgi:TP901 family phage tail tape measure protein